MGMSFPGDGLDKVKNRLQEFFEGFHEDLELVGAAGAEAIVRTTLAGIGEDDKPFAPYSPSYQALLDAVGGKSRQTVDLRGIFYHEGQKKKRFRKQSKRTEARADRRAYIAVAFKTKGGKVVSFAGMTKTTRPQMGLTDTNSEMSLDLIKVHATDDKLTLEYEPRDVEYMVAHQRGENGMPARVWFSAKKAAVWEAMVKIFAHTIEARVKWFNNGGGGKP